MYIEHPLLAVNSQSSKINESPFLLIFPLIENIAQCRLCGVKRLSIEPFAKQSPNGRFQLRCKQSNSNNPKSPGYSHTQNIFVYKYLTKKTTASFFLHLTYEVKKYALAIVVQIRQIIREISKVITYTNF